MADNKQNRGAQDRARINMTEDYEVSYWTKELGVSREQLADAVKKVGVSVSAIRAELDKRR